MGIIEILGSIAVFVVSHIGSEGGTALLSRFGVPGFITKRSHFIAKVVKDGYNLYRKLHGKDPTDEEKEKIKKEAERKADEKGLTD